MFFDKNLEEVLREEFGAYLVKGNLTHFELRSSKPLPDEVAQFAVSFSVYHNTNTISALNGQVIAQQSMGADYMYTFLNSSEGQFNIILNHALEKKRYRDFSKTFTEEVESELKR